MIVVGAITFILMHSAPGGPWDTRLNAARWMQSTQRSLNEYYGLDKPLWRQYIAYMIGDVNKDGKFVCGMICGNLGLLTASAAAPSRISSFPPRKTQTGFLKVQPFWLFPAPGLLAALLLPSSSASPRGSSRPCSRISWIDYVSLFIVTIGISVPKFRHGDFLDHHLWLLSLKLVPIVPRSWDEADGLADAGDRAGFWHPGAHRPPDARLDAGGDAHGLHPHRPRQRPGRAGRDLRAT